MRKSAVNRPIAAMLAVMAIVMCYTAGSSLTAAAGPSPAPADAGAITYLEYGADGFAQTWVACPDLTARRPVAPSPGRNTGYATWSPEGTRLAFDTDRDDADLDTDPLVSDVYTIAADGTDPRKLTRSDGFDGAPAWSPDGNRIAFQRSDVPGELAGIFTMDTDGGDRKRITSAPAGTVDWSPWFAPDGTRLTFTRIFNPLEPDNAKALSALYLVDLEGGADPMRITPEGVSPGDGVWSPDGSTIVFEVFAGGRGDTWAIAPDGTGLRNLTAAVPGLSWSRDPTWSPDGSSVLVPTSIGVVVITADGKQHRVLDPGDGIHQPDWSGTANC